MEDINYTKAFRESLYKLTFSLVPNKKKIGRVNFESIRLKRLLAVADIFMGLGSRNVSIKIYQKCFSIATKHEIDWAIAHSARQLYLDFSFFQKKKKEGEKLYKIFIKSKEKLDKEIECEYQFMDLIKYFSTTVNCNDSQKAKIIKSYDILSQVTYDKRTPKFERYFLIISIIRYETNNEIEKLIKYLKFRVRKEESAINQNENDIKLCLKYLCEYSLRKELFSEFGKSFEKGITLSKRFSQSWFRFKELESLYFIRTGKHGVAQQNLSILIRSKHFKAIPTYVRKRIELKFLYATMILLLKGRDLKSNKSILRKYLDFVENTPEYRNDKKAMNISLIIFQLLFYIWKRDFEMLEIRFEAINKYLRRYTRSSLLFRSHSFIKILLSLKQYNLVVHGAERSYKKYYKNLLSMPYKISPHPGEIEIIYYEELVDTISVHLNSRTRRISEAS